MSDYVKLTKGGTSNNIEGWAFNWAEFEHDGGELGSLFHRLE